MMRLHLVELVFLCVCVCVCVCVSQCVWVSVSLLDTNFFVHTKFVIWFVGVDRIGATYSLYSLIACRWGPITSNRSYSGDAVRGGTRGAL
jgi:hypothetical protein